MTWKDVSRYRTELMGAACLWIMGFHGFFIWPAWLSGAEAFFYWGMTGVEIFLLLSGIGLCYSYRGREGKIGAFYLRRFTRLLIPYLGIAGPYYLWYCTRTGKNFLDHLGPVAFLRDGAKGTWYVTAISFLYLIFPAIYHLQHSEWLKRKCKLESGTVTLLLCLLFWGLCRLLNVAAPEFYQHTEVMLTRFPVFVLGCGLAGAVEEERPIPEAAVAGAFAWTLIHIFALTKECAVPGPWLRMLLIPLSLSVVISFTWILKKLDRCKRIRGFLRFFGDRSLELYLLHVLLIHVWKTYTGKQPEYLTAPAYLGVLLVSAGIAAALHPLFQRLVGLFGGSGRKRP